MCHYSLWPINVLAPLRPGPYSQSLTFRENCYSDNMFFDFFEAYEFVQQKGKYKS